MTGDALGAERGGDPGGQVEGVGEEAEGVADLACGVVGLLRGDFGEGLEPGDDALLDAVEPCDDGAGLAELDDVDGGFDLGHAVIGPGEDFAGVALGGEAVGPPESATFGEVGGAFVETSIVGDQESAFAASDDLVGGDGEAADVSPGADEASLDGGGTGLCTVLDDHEAVLSCDLHDGGHVADGAEDVGGGDGDGARGDQGGDLLRVHGEGLIDVAEDGDALGGDDGSSGGDEADGGDDDLGPRSDTGGDKGGVEGAGPGGESDGVPGAEDLACGALEGLDARLLEAGVVIGQEGSGSRRLLPEDGADLAEDGRRIAEAPGDGHELVDVDFGTSFAADGGDGLESAFEGEFLNISMVNGHVHILPANGGGVCIGRWGGIR